MGMWPNKPNCSESGLKRVVPNNPEMSLLYQKLSHTHACGLEMPPAPLPKIPDAQIEQVRIATFATVP